MKYTKKLLSLSIIILTILGFIYYFISHPSSLSAIKNLSIINISFILFLYLLALMSLILILKFSVELCGIKIKRIENIQLTIWSNIANFFGPLQSGPGIRGLYLKKKYSLSLKKFLYVSLLYYGFIALISFIFIGLGSFAWYYGLLLILLSLTVIYFGFNFLTKRIKPQDRPKLALSIVIKLFVMTLIQLLITSIIYFVELKIVNKSIGFNQALVYCGVANLALFVSITPGAIGFRESFLLFSQKLHHISSSNVISASLIDRSVYIVFLLILIAVASFMHIGKKLKNIS